MIADIVSRFVVTMTTALLGYENCKGVIVSAHIAMCSAITVKLKTKNIQFAYICLI